MYRKVKLIGRRFICNVILVMSLMCLAHKAEAQNITVNFKDSPLKTVLKEIQKQTNYKFVYSDNVINSSSLVTLKVSGIPVEKVFDEIFTKNKIDYKIVGKQVILSSKVVSTDVITQDISNNRTISGLVKDTGGNPLPGVNVYVNNSKEAASTDLSGRFELKTVTNGSILSFLMIGMKTQMITVDNRKEYIVVLEEDIVKLQDVIVTGYQTISKERSAGAFVTVKGDIVKDKANISGSFIQSLEGQAPGLNVNIKSNGDEEFLIRGLTSINSNKSPLIVVDGVPVSQSILNNMVSNNDINSVTFLKDATAASIWGSRAANGVIVITTKNGTDTDKKIKVSYTGSYTNKGLPDYSYQNMMSSEMFIKTAKETFDPVAWPWDQLNAGTNNYDKPQVYRHEKILYDYNRGLISENQMNTELTILAALNNRDQYEKYFLQPAFNETHNVSITGGSNYYKYYFSIGYENNGSTSKTNTDKFIVNTKQEFNLTPWLKLDLGVNIGMTTVNNFLSPSGGTSTIPYMMFADDNGTALSHADLYYMESFRLSKQQLGDINLDFVPLTDTQGSFNKSVVNNARINAGINIKIFKGLSFDGRYYYQRGNGKNELYYSRNAWTVRNESSQFTQPKSSPTTLPTFYLPTTGGNYELTNTQSTDWTVRNQFAYERMLNNNKHQISALAGMELRAMRDINSLNRVKGWDPQLLTFQPFDEKVLSVTGITNPLIKNTTSGNNKYSNPSSQFTETEVRFISFYSNIGYTYKNRYSLNSSVRVDQSNLFGTDKSVQFKPIWSAGFVWNITNEQFMNKQKIFDRLLLRMSYGLSGNSPDPGKGGPYNVIRVKTVGNTIFNDLGTGFEVMYPANTRLTWEQTRTINAGVDFSVIKNKVNGSLDVYDKYTTNLLADLDLAATSGWSTTYANTGIMSNKGIELSVNSINVNQKDWKWSTNFTFSYNINKIVKLYDANKFFSVTKTYVEGYPANSLWAWRFAGLDNLGDPQTYNAAGELVKVSTAADPNPKLGENKSTVYAGVMTPPFYGGLTNTIKYKDFEFSFMFVYNLGHKMFSTAATYSGRLSRNLNQNFDKRWRAIGDDTNIPSYAANTSLEIRRNTDFYTRGDINVLDASYAKLRDLSITYSVPSRICNRLFADMIKVRLQATNLLTITANDQGIDPEAHNLSNGVRYNKYGPFLSFGLTVNFK